MAGSERVILVDGNALLYRAYYAIPASFTTADGFPTNAIYGFATMFRKMLAGKTPELGAVVFDAPGKTFRDELYPAYKADRRPMPDDLRAQLPWIDRLVAAYRFPMLRVPGYEADDVIGTLTTQAVDAGKEVFIVSGDKDFAQLIGDAVRMLDTLRDVTFDVELVRKKWGVRPDQFVDLLALMGDKADNIPGVPGIGAKGAATLLARYDSLDGVLAHVEELKGRPRNSLEAHEDLARLSRTLATIDCAVPLDLGLDDLRLTLPAPGELDGLYKELAFFSLLSDEATLEASDANADADYEICGTLAEVEALIATLGERSAGDPVTVLPLCGFSGPVHGALVGIAFGLGSGSVRLVAIDGDGGLGGAALDRLRTWFEDGACEKVTYNAKQLFIALTRRDVTLRGVVGDLMLESFLVEPTKIIPHRLSQIAREYLQLTVPPAKAVVGSGQKRMPFAQIPIGDLLPWVAQRADVVARAWPVVRGRLEGAGQLEVLETVELPLAFVLGGMECAGIAVDPDDLARMGDDFADRLGTLGAIIHRLAGKTFNIGSPKQLGTVLFDILGLPVIKRTKSGYSTNAEVLERLRPHHEIAQHLLDYRKLSKLINTYTDVLQRAVHPASGRIHATFQQTVGATGRLITTDPDLQRTPIKTAEGKRIRQTFVAPLGRRLISADWSQIELRLLAHFSGDERLIDAFARDLDIHRRTAGELFGVGDLDAITTDQRRIGKLVNFATIYGQGATALGKIIGVSRAEAQRYIEGYFEAYSGVRAWLDATMEQARSDGYATTLLGRRRVIPELSSNSFMDRLAGERIAANTPIQGSAADLCKLAMLRIDQGLSTAGHATRMLLQVHDELVFEAPDDEVEAVSSLVRDAMENVHPLRVPLKVDVGVGASWAEAH